MTFFLLAFAAIQLLGLFAIVRAVRQAPVAVENTTGFRVIRRASSAQVVA